MDLNGKVIVVTGGLGTLGRAATAAAVAAGATTVCVDFVDGTPADGVIATPAVDLGNAEAAKAALAAIAEKYGKIDGLVNIAGGFAWETVTDGAIDTWDSMYQMNVRTAVNACKGAIPFFPEAGGRIINISAAGSIKADMGMGAYAASKAGVAKLTEALAQELKARNITVNALLPSIIDTKPNRDSMPDADVSTWVSPAALADVILFLLSKASEPVTGALIPVMGRV
ncbi:SDR family NAD(P)-dependent oxidoreductase [Halioxenophilus sp. WMMB6]|uniref:SDR family NAD(P)-dependent oxidoreductase n=1 Tax=Halioxenophilus sp. WMMB6 TaxID=3073815 RepID=UPI00295E589F|nr:SDR family NAD(P)-dependent oxidoreductase [Halioxenophilus sp. WMMB6]